MVTSAPCRLLRGLKRRLRGPGTELLKAKILLGGPCESGKTILANFLTEASDITKYNPTQGVRILEFENPRVTSNNKGAGCEFELWGHGSDPESESCWPALMKDSHAVVIIFNASILSPLKEIEMWCSCFVQQQFLKNTPCLLITHHKPGSGSDKENPALAPPLNKLKLVHSNLEDDPEEIRMEFIKYLRSIINSVSESKDREEMSIITWLAFIWMLPHPK